MKFTTEIEIDDLHLKILLDYHNGYTIDSEYIEMQDLQTIEEEMVWKKGLLTGGFYAHYPLSPTPLGAFILKQYINKK